MTFPTEPPPGNNELAPDKLPPKPSPLPVEPVAPEPVDEHGATGEPSTGPLSPHETLVVPVPAPPAELVDELAQRAGNEIANFAIGDKLASVRDVLIEKLGDPNAQLDPATKTAVRSIKWAYKAGLLQRMFGNLPDLNDEEEWTRVSQGAIGLLLVLQSDGVEVDIERARREAAEFLQRLYDE